MTRTSVTFVSLAVLAAAGGLAYVQASRTSTNETNKATAVVAAPRATETPAAIAAATNISVDAPENVRAPQQPEVKNVSQWLADVQSPDAKTRATAIAALANAPKAQAVPALERVLESGEPQVDRQIALQSLHTLALNDGDSNGKIRDVIRHAMYHSDDDGVVQSAQALLEDIEAEFTERAQGAKPN